jgi:hypothetical protein
MIPQVGDTFAPDSQHQFKVMERLFRIQFAPSRIPTIELIVEEVFSFI